MHLSLVHLNDWTSDSIFNVVYTNEWLNEWCRVFCSNIMYVKSRHSFTWMSVSVSCLIIWTSTTEWVSSSCIWVFSEVKDPIPLWHFSKNEILTKIDLMGDQFDIPDLWRGPGPISAICARAGHQCLEWRGCCVWCSQRPQERMKTPSLMADIFGFASEEEIEDTKAYLWNHGQYQLEQVGERVSVFGLFSAMEWMSDSLLNSWMSDCLPCCKIWLSVSPAHMSILSLNWMSVYVLCLFTEMNVWTSDIVGFFMVWLQVDGTGNCLFSTIKKLLSVRTAMLWAATYFPNHYFRRMVINCIINYQQLIYKNKFLALMSLYGVKEQVDPNRGWNPPLSFKQYLRLLLQRDFWGDEVVLHAISCMWSMKIIVLNTKTLQEYCIRHNKTMEKADI